MDGVGARLGRSSNRYAPTTTVFTGPVRRWKKKWIHGTPPNSGNNNRPTANGGVNGNNGSHLLLFKWTPITSSQNSNGATNSSGKDDGFIDEEPPKRKFKYIPINVLEEQKNDEQAEDDIKPIESDTNSEEPTSQADGYDEKPDINDMPMVEIQAPQKKPPQRQDLNERTLDLSLG